MNHFRKDLEKPKGQVLLATLLFCFVFAVLFAGLYKAGVVYSLKERSNRGSELTAVSAGAVYANGLQLVRLTNVFLIAFAILDLTIIAAKVAAATVVSFGALTALALASDPKFRKIVQDLQKVLFGIDIPLPGLYPSLIFTESLSINDKNSLANNWFQGGLTSFHLPIPPQPLFLFNAETSSPLLLSVIPSMALKLRTADQFIQDMGNPKNQKVYYRYKDSQTGEYHYVEEKDTQLARGSVHSGQRRTKEGNKLLELKPVFTDAQQQAEEDAEKDLEKSGMQKIGGAFKALAPLLTGITMDVTDRDDPPNHTFIAYTSLPTRVSTTTASNAQIQSVSEVSVEGPGLAAWDLMKPLYQARRVNLNPTRLTELLLSEKGLQSLVDAKKIPTVTNLFDTSNLLNGL
jgi:hypothetical protein